MQPFCTNGLCTLATIVAEIGDSRRFLIRRLSPKWRLLPKSATVAEFGDKLSPKSATIVSSADRALDRVSYSCTTPHQGKYLHDAAV